MTQQELIDKLKENHTVFTDYINSLTAEEFMLSRNEKWTAGQQLDHIRLSVKPVNQALAMPKLGLKAMFGKANRPSKSYDELVTKYKLKLQEGGVATSRFIPTEVTIEQREKLIKSVNDVVGKLCKQLLDYSEKNLDELILPHPLLGKLTLREMMYFTIYHVVHHYAATEKSLK
ncbi:MAG: DinB family protein [Flammeovirgaceae bacterium]|nr:DinB family protein [Flammeovirgaceae bacterium]